MSTTATPGQSHDSSDLSQRDRYLATFRREHATTLRLLRAFPSDKLELRPAEKCKTARELAWTLVLEQYLVEKALTTGFDWENMPASATPQPPETMEEIAQALEQGQDRIADRVQRASVRELAGTVSWFVKPKTLGEVPKLDLMWMLLYDHIHHRGQLSIYLRMAGGKVPSIYGPTADEQWV